MTVDEALLLRVGIDTGSGGAHGPLFPDGRFEYVPIPEPQESTQRHTYAELSGRYGEPLSTYVPHLADRVPHHDPEFTTYTYGDVGKIKCSQLSRLTEGDLLVFYAGLEPVDGTGPPLLYAIGYLTVSEVADLEAMTETERAAAIERFPNNAHAKRTALGPDSRASDRYPVIVRGKPTRSGLFARARPLGDEERLVVPEVARAIGFEGDLTRAGAARILDVDRIEEIRRWLEGEIG
jgi:hypothetical protein